jgi:hypothetical protein
MLSRQGLRKLERLLPVMLVAVMVADDGCSGSVIWTRLRLLRQLPQLL